MQIKQDVLSMMVQYLRSEKLFMAAVVIQDEANMKTCLLYTSDAADE